MTPGSNVQRKTPRAPSVPSNAVAHNGPSTAPIVSIARSNPNARPCCFGATQSASSVSRDGPRLPRPTQPRARISRIAGQVCAKAYANVESPVAKYPMMPVGLRHLGRSAIQPPASVAKLERPSETPSITPSANAGAPRLARNAGRIAVAASCPQSENRLARPMPRTPRVSQRFAGADELALELSPIFVTGISGRTDCEDVSWAHFRSEARPRSRFSQPNCYGPARQARSRALASG